VLRAVSLVINDWQLSGIFTGGSGARYTIGYGYQTGGGNVNITGSPNYGGRVVIVGDPGSGCSDNQYQQFKRVDLFNAFNEVIFTGRQTNMNLQSPTNQTLTNPQYNPDGTLVATRLTPNNAGFGAVTGATGPRSVQMQLRFSF
jgi:hypothetical protein